MFPTFVLNLSDFEVVTILCKFLVSQETKLASLARLGRI